MARTGTRDWRAAVLQASHRAAREDADDWEPGRRAGEARDRAEQQRGTMTVGAMLPSGSLQWGTSGARCGKKLAVIGCTGHLAGG